MPNPKRMGKEARVILSSTASHIPEDLCHIPEVPPNRPCKGSTQEGVAAINIYLTQKLVFEGKKL